MWKYLKAAFLFGVPVPALGSVPVNALAAAGFAILGFGHPGFWLLGLAVETTVVLGLAFNPRFQRLVNSRRLQFSSDDTSAHRQALIDLLSSEARARLTKLIDQCNKVLQVCRGTQAYDFVVATNRDALSNLQWLYLKLLVGRHYLETASGSDEQTLKKNVESLEHELKDPNVTDTLRQSKTATLAIMRQRMNNYQNRARIMAEIDSDLTRIEAQVDLALENASIQGKPQTISSEIELASDLVSGTLFGESQNDVAALDRAFTQSPQARQRVIN